MIKSGNEGCLASTNEFKILWLLTNIPSLLAKCSFSTIAINQSAKFHLVTHKINHR